MRLPLYGEDTLEATSHYDDEMRLLADRHYSRRTVGARQFAYAGRKLVLRNPAGTVLFVWLWALPELRLDGQDGYNCAIFRNESDRLSSNIIAEAESHAVAKWGPRRFYTYVNPARVRSTNPGYCFLKAGWRKVGISKSGLILLAKEAEVA